MMELLTLIDVMRREVDFQDEQLADAAKAEVHRRLDDIQPIPERTFINVDTSKSVGRMHP